MKIGFYCHKTEEPEDGSGGGRMVYRFLKKDAQKSQYKDRFYLSEKCLCEAVEERTPDVVLCHPADSDASCFSGIKEAVERNPETTFYIFSIGRPAREKGIGKHPNVKYVNQGNSYTMTSELVSLVGSAI